MKCNFLIIVFLFNYSISLLAENSELRAGLPQTIEIGFLTDENNLECSAFGNPAMAKAIQEVCGEVGMPGAQEITSTCFDQSIKVTFRCVKPQICLGGLCSAGAKSFFWSQASDESFATPSGALPEK